MNKVELLHIIQSRISDRIENLEQLILDKRNSNNDTKSSMGDKYETGREMLQQEINNLQNQLNAFLLQKQSILSIKTDKCSKVEKGSLVETEKGMFYISASVGEIHFEEKKIFAVSEESPLAMAMKGKVENERFAINNISQVIKNIW